MIGFALACLVLVLAVLAVLAWPFRRARPSAAASPDRRQLNVAIYREQIERLDQDVAAGVLAADAVATERAELQRRLLEDTQAQAHVAAAPAGRVLPTGATPSPRRTLIVLSLLLPLVAVGLYLAIGTPAAVLPVDPVAEQRFTAQDMERAIEKLAQRLEQEPDNLKGWAMLGRSYKATNRPQEAEKAFDRAGSYLDTDAAALAAFADVAAVNRNGNFAGKPLELIQRALRVDPDHAMSLWLLGSAEFKAARYAAAAAAWERLAPQFAPDSEDGRAIASALDDARTKAREAGQRLPPPPTRADAQKPVTGLPSGQPPSAGSAGAGTAALAAAGSISGKVELAPELKAKVRPDDTVMVLARAPGTRMPLAVLRAKVQDLPLSYTLNDSLAMSPQARLSGVTDAEVEARISRSGQAKPEPGDHMSATRTVRVGTSNLQLLIDQTRP